MKLIVKESVDALFDEYFDAMDQAEVDDYVCVMREQGCEMDQAFVLRSSPNSMSLKHLEDSSRSHRELSFDMSVFELLQDAIEDLPIQCGLIRMSGLVGGETYCIRRRVGEVTHELVLVNVGASDDPLLLKVVSQLDRVLSGGLDVAAEGSSANN